MTSLLEASRTGLAADSVEATVRAYRALHDEAAGGDLQSRKHHYARMVNQYYDLVTDFYEYGWGDSFHFAPRHRKESFRESIVRHEYHLALRLNLAPGMRVLDMGCGVGGPMRNIARLSGAHVTGVNNNAYQIQHGHAHCRKARLESVCDFIKADFMQIPVDDSSFDAAYTIEASCHAPDRVAAYAEMRRCLKPGSLFAGYEWCLTDRYDQADPHHRAIKNGIEEGNALPDILHTHSVDQALVAAGFELIEARDLAPESHPDTPWYLPITGEELNLSGLGRTRIGRMLITQALRIMERVGLAPKGVSDLHGLLDRTADWLAEGGRTGVFTPLYFFLAKKPLN